MFIMTLSSVVVTGNRQQSQRGLRLEYRDVNLNNYGIVCFYKQGNDTRTA